MPARYLTNLRLLSVCALCAAACAADKAETSEPAGVGTAGVSGTVSTLPEAGKSAAGDAAGGTGAQPPEVAAGSGGSGTVPSAGAPSAGQSGQLGQAGQVAAAGGGGAGAAASGEAGAAGSGEPMTTEQPAIDPSCSPWPSPTGDQAVRATIRVSGHFDGELRRYAGAGALGAGGQEEGQDPLFLLSSGATLENVILGAPAADGVHCEGSCTLRNVWWEDVGEDAATLKGSSSSQVMSVECGGAKKAADKVFQHNGPGTVRIQNFRVEDFGKLYRSCGNCRTQHERHVEMKNIEAAKGLVLAGINTNYGDTAKFEHITLRDSTMRLGVCDRYTGNSQGSEPRKTGSGADGSNCLYDEAEITWAP